MSDPFLGEIRMFGFGFAPKGWASCNGQLLPISQNQALFSLLGTTYGGDGRTTFALPDLRGRVPINQGQGPGLSAYAIGQQAGSESETLAVNQLPAHNHPVNAAGGPTSNKPAGNVLAGAGGPRANTYAAAPDGTVLHAGAVGQAGGGQPHNNVQPTVAVSFCIALTGIYPPRD